MTAIEDALIVERDELRAEVARLTADNDRLLTYIDGERSRHLELVVNLGEQVTKLTSELVALRERERWIPCKEKMPDHSLRVDVWGRAIDYDGTPAAWCRSSAYWTGKEWEHDWYTVRAEITHWRPLPQPPQEVGE